MQQGNDNPPLLCCAMPPVIADLPVDTVYPFFSTLVESESSARTPSSPHSANRATSYSYRPKIYRRGIADLKIPGCTTTHKACNGKPTQSTTLWLTRMNSISKTPSLTLSPGTTL